MRALRRAALAALTLAGNMGPALAAAPLAPPAMYPADTWQGRDTAVLRVLNRLDSHVQTLTVQAGSTTHYETLEIGVARCLQQAPTLRPDAAAWLDIQDTRPQGAVFHGWMLAGEPSVGVLESPIYDVRIVSCQGNEAPPPLPPLEQPKVPSLPGKEAGSEDNTSVAPAPSPQSGSSANELNENDTGGDAPP
ncbi:hypothetical protein AA0472_2647 [Acetobacter estunensis NRIC 0472]|uniref:DUF2155 domain-containing protein n=1 Tax=Acetobacter estunensis TaxID=104097 RepID=A0A967EAW3_9PROT|nr:DUF2155 domain-containing protein [Acetobacter estunensis]NHO52808.1 DUF2155 domain-containing protein [Acetobacter estunensis]GBQ28288.1 hypothetical protein AA0472_2647 [Acetobacter estunensis NRIC 0472]